MFQKIIKRMETMCSQWVFCIDPYIDETKPSGKKKKEYLQYTTLEVAGTYVVPNLKCWDGW